MCRYFSGRRIKIFGAQPQCLVIDSVPFPTRIVESISQCFWNLLASGCFCKIVPLFPRFLASPSHQKVPIPVTSGGLQPSGATGAVARAWSIWSSEVVVFNWRLAYRLHGIFYIHTCWSSKIITCDDFIHIISYIYIYIYIYMILYVYRYISIYVCIHILYKERQSKFTYPLIMTHSLLLKMARSFLWRELSQ